MTETRLTKTRIAGGLWEGVLTGPDTAPRLEVLLHGRSLPGVAVVAMPGQAKAWAVQVPIPPDVLSDGVQTFLIREMGMGQTLAHFTVITGVAMEDDLRAEVDLLRQELDMLKRAFRRHCLETQ